MVTKDEFASSLRRTMDELENAARTSSVLLPPVVQLFLRGGTVADHLRPRQPRAPSARLGEVKALCSVLYEAKVNSLDNLRRERVSGDDLRGPQSDFLESSSITNSLAVLTPYEVTFHCFSTELASVLAGFARDPHGFVIKAMNVEPGALQASADSGAPGYPGHGGAPAPAAHKGRGCP